MLTDIGLRSEVSLLSSQPRFHTSDVTARVDFPPTQIPSFQRTPEKIKTPKQVKTKHPNNYINPKSKLVNSL